MKNFSLYGLPENVTFCRLCVISNQRPSSTVEFKNSDGKNKPGISINEDGICDACAYNKKKSEINWKKREEKLFRFLEKYRKNNGEYDCIVPSSGGKDSSFTAHILKTKYKMNPLAVTWAPNMWTEAGFENFNNLSRVGGVDSILITPNGKLHRYLTKISFLNLGHPFQPFIHGQKIIGPLIALKFDIPLIFYGENQAEYGNTVEENSNPKMDNKFFSNKNNSETILGGEKLSNILKNYNFNLNDFEPYMAPSLDDLNKKKIEQRYLGYYLKWDPQECYYYAAKNTGFRPNTERTEGSYSKYSSIDDKIDPFHYFLTHVKFGLGRASYDASQEIRNEKITRDEGINLVKKYDSEFPKKYFKEFLEYIGINEDNFFSTLDQFRSPHLWKKNKKEWKLLQKIY